MKDVVEFLSSLELHSLRQVEYRLLCLFRSGALNGESVPAICAHVRINRKTFQKALNALKRAGLVAVISDPGRVNTYEVNL